MDKPILINVGDELDTILAPNNDPYRKGIGKSLM